MKDWVVVVPTIRKEQFMGMLESFQDLFKKYALAVLIVEDNPEPTFEVPQIDGLPILHYSWRDIEMTLGEDSWIIPRRSDCIRSYGFLMAKEFVSTSYVLTLDDDVRYNGVDIFAAYEAGFEAKGVSNAPFWDTMQVRGNISPRGFPFKHRTNQEVMLQWGMWEGVPDLDGVTQLANPITDFKIPECYAGKLQIIPKGIGVTGCIMNCAFKHEVIPAMYQLLMGQDKDGNAWPYDRWGDIWSGFIAKRYVEDVLGGAVAINYAAHVKHERASNVFTNIKKEASGYEVNEDFWENLNKRGFRFTSYESIADHASFELLFNRHSDKYSEAMKIWSIILKK